MKRILTVTLLVSAFAAAAPVRIEGGFTRFRSYLFKDSYLSGYGAIVNGIALTGSGVETVEPGFGATSQWSDWVTFQTPPSTVSFGPTQNGAVFGNYNSFSWVAPSGSTEVIPGQVFRFGRLNFTNGSYYYMTELDLRLQAVCTGTAAQCANFGPHEFTGTVRLISNSGDGTNPQVEADQFFIVQRPDLGSVFVYDIDYQPPGNPGSTGSIFLNGYIGSLIPTGFEAANGAAFLGSSIPEDPNSGGGGGEVPEPSTFLLVLGGIALSAWRRK